VAWSSKEMD